MWILNNEIIYVYYLWILIIFKDWVIEWLKKFIFFNDWEKKGFLLFSDIKIFWMGDGYFIFKFIL